MTAAGEGERGGREGVTPPRKGGRGRKNPGTERKGGETRIVSPAPRALGSEEPKQQDQNQKHTRNRAASSLRLLISFARRFSLKGPAVSTSLLACLLARSFLPLLYPLHVRRKQRKWSGAGLWLKTKKKSMIGIQKCPTKRGRLLLLLLLLLSRCTVVKVPLMFTAARPLPPPFSPTPEGKEGGGAKQANRPWSSFAWCGVPLLSLSKTLTRPLFSTPRPS